MEWQRFCLSKEMKKRPNSAEGKGFNVFVATLPKLQKQLENDYQNDLYLRYRILTTIDIPSMQNPLRDSMPRTTKHILASTVRMLSHRPQKAGTLAAHVIGSE